MANKKVASLLSKHKSKYPFIYRIHDDPDEDKLLNLKQTISPLGYTFNFKGKNSSMEINKLFIRYKIKRFIVNKMDNKY